MIRQDPSRFSKRQKPDYRKTQFEEKPAYKGLNYPYRLNFYAIPPTADITLEQFEQWAIDRLRGMTIQGIEI
jgi:DNA primase large subunit